MTHYLKIGDKNITVSMGCNHPDMKNNSTDSIGCNGDCGSCTCSIASVTIPEMMFLMEAAGTKKA